MDLNGKQVLLISPEPWEGLQLSKHDLARALQEKGCTVVFWGPPTKGTLRTRLDDREGIRVVRYRHWLRGANRLGRSLHLRYYRRAIARLEELNGRAFDIIWCFDISRMQWFPEHPALKILHLADHDILYDHPGSGLIRTAHMVYTVTEPLRKAVKELVPEANVENVGHMVSDHWLEHTDRITVAPKARIVALAGNLKTPYIDWEVLNKIISAHPELEFQLYGPYDLDYPVPMLRETLTRPNVRLKGLVDRTALVAALRKADVLLVCYNAERLGPVVANSHKLLEYLATGHPIVSSWTEEYADRTDLVHMTPQRWDLPSLFSRIVNEYTTYTAASLREARMAIARKRTANATVQRLVETAHSSVRLVAQPPARKRILFIASKVVDSKEYEDMASHWDHDRFVLEFLFLNPQPDSKTQRVLRARGFRSTTYRYRSRFHLIPLVIRLMFRLWRTRPDVVHGNLLEGSFVALIAGRLTGIGRLVYTRHHTTHNHKYHPGRGVLYDHVINRLAHRIVAITGHVREVLTSLEGVPAEKITVMRHGVELGAPVRLDPEREARLLRKYDLQRTSPFPLIAVVSRPFAWKGLDHAIPAFGSLLQRWPDARLMLFHWAPGPQTAHYEALLDRLPRRSWRTVRWESELDALFPRFDALIHVPEDPMSEPFGYIYIEALSSGTPSVMTRSGILSELDESRLEGLTVVPYKDAEAITEALVGWLVRPPSPDERAAFATNNTRYLSSEVSMQRKMDQLAQFYGSL